MTIHHDKMAYGRLAKTSDELSEEKVLEMLKELAEEQDGETRENNQDNKEQTKKPSV